MEKAIYKLYITMSPYLQKKENKKKISKNAL